jgi:hypothetical protein
MSRYLLVAPNPGLSDTPRGFVCNDNVVRMIRSHQVEEAAPKAERSTIFKTQKAAKAVVEDVFRLNTAVKELELLEIWCGGQSLVTTFKRK